MDNLKALVSNPVDDNAKEEIQKTIKAVLGYFSAFYVKQYTLGLVKKALDEASTEPGPEWKLQERPPRTDSFKEGYVMKEGGNFLGKSMAKRYFVVRPDYMIDYYENEVEAKKEKGKKKGTISLCGYSINDDANRSLLGRLKGLAEKFGLDTSALPKQKEYPKNTMELHHSRRESFYLQCEDNDEFQQWLQQMKTCAWRAYGYKNRDPVHVEAFDESVRLTREKLGRWGYWSWGGTEEQVLSDMIADELEYTVMSGIYAKIQGPWSVRSMIRDKVCKLVDKMVLTAVTPAWKGMSSTVEEMRPKIEPKIKENVGPIGEAKLKLKTQIKDACMSIITPAMEQHVNPHLGKILAAIQSPVGEAFDESYNLFVSDVVEKLDAKETPEETQKGFSSIDYFPYSWKFWDVTRKVDTMHDPLLALNVVFKDIYPWSLIWEAHDMLRGKMDNAVYTFEQKLLEAQKNPETGKDTKACVSSSKDLTLADYKFDGRQAMSLYFLDIIKKIVMPPINATVIPASEAVLSPMNDTIPEPVRQFIDVNDTFQEVLESVLDDTIKQSLESDPKTKSPEAPKKEVPRGMEGKQEEKVEKKEEEKKEEKKEEEKKEEEEPKKEEGSKEEESE